MADASAKTILHNGGGGTLEAKLTAIYLHSTNPGQDASTKLPSPITRSIVVLCSTLGSTSIHTNLQTTPLHSTTIPRGEPEALYVASPVAWFKLYAPSQFHYSMR